ncbi:uncharacterized protein mettl21ca [Polymixia lowei]
MIREETDEEEEEEEEEGDDEVNREEARGTEDGLCSEESDVQTDKRPAWAPSVYYKVCKEVYYYAGQEIIIQESLDSYAGMIWPAALVLCKYLETHCEQFSILDKAVLEIGSGTGLLSIVATLLGAWVTATDLPDVLGNLRFNLSKNTRGRCRHTPQVAELSWGYDLDHTYPKSLYHYDFVLAADVVYHHDFLDELLVTMKHFCQPGTTLIWANKVRYKTDLTFTESFKKTFHTSLLFEDGEMKIFMATCREGGIERDLVEEIQDELEKKQREEEEEAGGRKAEEGEREEENGEEGEKEEMKERCSQSSEQMNLKDEGYEEDERDEKEKDDSRCTPAHDEDVIGEEDTKQTPVQQESKPAWAPSLFARNGKDIYHYAGQEIGIYETIDSFGAVMWPAALALCSFLDTNRQRVNLLGKEVLELGAGTGLVAIVATLLGASVTATDLPFILSNLTANLMRNTRGRCRHTPQVAELSWGYDLDHTYPKSVYHYDFVLAADVVYHHDFLDELLVTMKHFCQPGTTLIWANKVRFETDLTFTENFKKTFHTSVLFDDGDMKIFMATCRERGRKREGDLA